MADITIATRRSSLITINRALKAILQVFLLAVSINAQEIPNITYGLMPPSIAPGSPAGSYALSGFDDINLYSGQINFRLPLLQVGARGGAGYTMTLNFDQRWRVITFRDSDPVEYFLSPESDWFDGYKAGYGPGILQGRRVGTNYLACPLPVWGPTLTRLTFTTPDGTQHELRDTLNNGKPLNVACSQSIPHSRGTVFTSSGGEAMTFISDSTITDSLSSAAVVYVFPSGMLYFRDGARYRIDGGTVTWMQDRNGNRVSFIYDGFKRVTQIKDSINRVITISYANLTNIFYDQITFKGAGGATRVLRVWHANLGQVLRAGYSLGSESSLFPELNDGLTDPYDPIKVSMVELPDGRSYKFYYNPYGELARTELPTGGAYEYDYNLGSGCLNPAGSTSNAILRRVKKRRVYPDGVTVEGETVYNETIDQVARAVYVEVDKYDQPGGTLLEREKHDFDGDPIFPFFGMLPTDYPSWKESREYQTEKYAVINGVVGPVLQRTATAWAQRASVSWYPLPLCYDRLCTPDYEPALDTRVLETMTTLVDTNQVAKQSFVYDDSVPFNNVSDVYEYDYGSGAPGGLIRRTHTDYVVSGSYINAPVHLRSLSAAKKIYDAGNTLRAQTSYEYDNYNQSGTDVFHAALSDCPSISGHDAAFSTGYFTRGNFTKITNFLLNNSGGATGSISGYAQYDIAGNVVKAIDPRSTATPLNIIATIFNFSDNFGSADGAVQSNDLPLNTSPSELSSVSQSAYAFPFKATNALGHTSYMQYDYHLGKPVDAEDQNNIKLSLYYADALDRPTKGIRAVGATTANQTVFVYNDNNFPVNGNPARSITTINDKDVFGESNNGNGLKSVALYDGLGRTWRSAGREGSTWTITDTRFDPLGRVSQVSNPYRAADPGSASAPAGLWKTTDYDSLGRVIKLTSPDTAHVDTAYSGNQVTGTDQAGKKRRTQVDALGRLTMVTEDPGGLNYDTVYSYDPMNNLRYVGQGNQGRWFGYDSLSRLIRVRNPEQDPNSNLPSYTDPFTGGSGWSAAYSYDNNGNLTSRTDARNVTTTITYDALNRRVAKTYTGGVSTPQVNYFYDQQGLPVGAPSYNRGFSKGRLVAVTYSGGSAGDYFGYDELGRPNIKYQRINTTNYPIQATYNKAGMMTGDTYPSTRTVSYGFDTAGRLTNFAGTLGDGVLRTYAAITQYNPAGQTERESYGTNTALYLKLLYNKRQQLADLRLSSVNDASDFNRGALQFYYGPISAANQDPLLDDSSNNGNLIRQWSYVPKPGGGVVTTQLDNYTYDSLNRVETFTEGQINEIGTFVPNVATQTFAYDRWGNRGVTSATGAVSNYNPTYDTTFYSNRIVGLGYDQAGSITSDPLTGGTMTYDAESRLLTATNGGGGSYVYDGDGKRIKRIAAGQEWWYVYGIGGELIAEYLANAPTTVKKEYGYRGGQLLIAADGGSTTNLALGKTATQSSTYLSGVASRGVDGNTDGNWANNSVTHTNNEYQPWWQVDLGSVQQIGTVKVWNRTDCCGERLSNFFVLVSDAPFISTDLATTISQAGVSGYYVAGPLATATEVSVYRTGRYMRIQLAGTNPLHVAEVEVRGGTGIQWLVTDHLGSPRMVVDQTGSLGGIKRHDYAPFGEELTGGIRSTGAYGYVGSNVRQKFAASERDAETGLDMMGARYCSSVQGRFISVDPLLASGEQINPQSWNRYSYVWNNPLILIDPTGMDPGNDRPNSEDIERLENAEEQQQQRTIHIFVNFTTDEQTTTPTTEGSVPLPSPANFHELVHNAPANTAVRLYTKESGTATLTAMLKAIQDPNAAAVIYIGHMAEGGGSIRFAPDPHGTDPVVDRSKPIPTEAAVVAIMGCDSENMRGRFNLGGQQSFIGMDGGPNDLTTIRAITKAGFAVAKSLISGGDVESAVSAGNQALTTAWRGTTLTVGGKQVQQHPGDKGDRVRAIP